MPCTPRTTLGRLHRRLAREDGVTLIETVIAAAILVMVIGAVLATLDASSSATTTNRVRTIAAAFAERDQENLRAMRTQDLANLVTAPRTTTAGAKNEYTIVSNVQWVRDATSGEANCTSNSRQADYLQLTSTVSSKAMGKRMKPVQLRSLIAPRVGDGTLAVKVVNQADVGVTGIPITITGPASMSSTTNAQGCAVFGHIDPGAYTVRATQLGFVDPAGKATAETTGTVTAGTVNVTTLRYAPAASVTVNFDTKVGSAAPRAATSLAVTAANSGIPSPGVRVFSAPAAPLGTIVASGLFPFTDGYAFYSGGCASANPTLYQPSYYSTNPGSVTVGPGGSATVTVREPALNMRVTRANSQSGAPAFQQARVLIKSTSAGCSDVFTINGLTANGELAEPGFPFGTYSVCADDSLIVSPNSQVHRTTVTGVALNNPNGLGSQLNVWIDANGATSGRCT